MPQKEDNQNIKNTIKNLLSSNKTKQAVELLMRLTKGSEDENQVTLQASRLNNIRKLVDSGVLNYTQAGEELNRIMVALLNLTDSIELNNAVFTIPENEKPIQKKFSEEFKTSTNKLNNVWIVSLLFGFMGLVLMIFSNFSPNSSFGQPAFWIGSIMLISSFIFFWIIQQKGTSKLSKSISTNRELIDELQQISITLSKVTRRMTLYAATNSNNINELLNVTTPILGKIGILNEKAEQAFGNSQEIINKIVEYSEEIEESIKDVETALIDGDSKKLKIYSQKISELASKIKLNEKKKTVQNRVDGRGQ